MALRLTIKNLIIELYGATVF